MIFGEAGLRDLDTPRVTVAGNDVTLVASLAMMPRSIEAAQRLTTFGISAEVIDVRVLRPFAASTIVSSVKKTSRLLTVEEQGVHGGWGSNVVAAVVEQAFDYLDAPPTFAARATRLPGSLQPVARG